MWFSNRFSQISQDSPEAGISFYASSFHDRAKGRPLKARPPEDFLRMKEWISRVQTAAQQARDAYTEDEAARAHHQRQLQVSRPQFEDVEDS